MARHIALWGAESDDDDTDDTDETTDTSTTRTLTEEEINKMVSRAADRGSRKAARQLATDLGFGSVTEVKEWFAARKAEEDASKDEATKVLEEAQRATTEAEADRQRMRNDRLNLRIDREVLRAGIVDEKRATRIATLVRADLDPEIDEDDWTEHISNLLGEMKTETPELFGKVSHGTADGGATGEAKTSNDQETREKQWTAEYRAKGMIEMPTPQ